MRRFKGARRYKYAAAATCDRDRDIGGGGLGVQHARVLPVTVDVQQEVGGADGESDLVPQAIGEAVREGLGARLAFEAVVVADLLPHSAALQLEVAAAAREETRSERNLTRAKRI